jgi:predicted RNA-binding protein with PIN domain
MNYIIDGHNLIAKIQGLNLSMPDDEQRLIELLNRYGELRRHKMEVFFDGAPFGQAGVRNYGRVRTHFVRRRLTADDAIRMRLVQLGQAAANWVVVTSDHSVQAVGREAHAQVMSSEDFAIQLQNSLLQTRPLTPKTHPDQPLGEALSEAEVKEWLAIFNDQGKQK